MAEQNEEFEDEVEPDLGENPYIRIRIDEEKPSPSPWTYTTFNYTNLQDQLQQILRFLMVASDERKLGPWVADSDLNSVERTFGEWCTIVRVSYNPILELILTIGAGGALVFRLVNSYQKARSREASTKTHVIKERVEQEKHRLELDTIRAERSRLVAEPTPTIDRVLADAAALLAEAEIEVSAEPFPPAENHT
jgi:hypothetical protein